MNVIYELSKNKTIILISHRLYNVRKSDNIYVLDKGNIVENGNHEELMKKEGLYFNLVEEQNKLERIGAEECA